GATVQVRSLMLSLRHPLRGRCRAWRPAARPDGHPATHEPGSCRACWRPCFAAPQSGTAFCTECWQMLAAHPSGRVRAAVAARKDIPRDVLGDLADDMHAPVAYAARDRLETLTARRAGESDR